MKRCEKHQLKWFGMADLGKDAKEASKSTIPAMVSKLNHEIRKNFCA
jgi:hypothetical protein